MVARPGPAPMLEELSPDDVLVVFRRVVAEGHTRPRAMRTTWATVLEAAQAQVREEIAEEAETAAERALAAIVERLDGLESRTLRVERIAGSVVTAGAAVAVTFAKPFAAPPIVLPIPSWSGEQIIEATAGNITTTGARVLVKRSRGTLLLTNGPFENAPAGTPFAMMAIGT